MATAMCRHAKRIPCDERIICSRGGKDTVCIGQKACKVTGRQEMSERVKAVCKYYVKVEG